MAYKAIVEGEVMVRNSAGITELDFYEESFFLDDSIDSEGVARQIIRKGLLTDRLSKKVKGFRRVRTCQIVGLEKTSDKAENSDLDKLLTEAVNLGCVPTNIDNYRRPDYKLKALQKAIDNEKARQEKLKGKKSNVQDMGYID